MIFTKDDTSVAKGIAVILLLIHHLFYATDGDWVNLAKIGKVCVAMFLILSGYGLAASFSKFEAPSFEFIKKHPLILIQLLLECLLFSIVLEQLKALCKGAFMRGKNKLSPHIRRQTG